MRSPSTPPPTPTNAIRRHINAGVVAPDELLCYCDVGIDYATFESLTSRNPEMAFDEVCETLGVGRRCTACLLNAETAYYRASGRKVADKPSKGQRARRVGEGGNLLSGWRGWKRATYSLVDAAMPWLSLRRVEVAPIVRAPGLSTTVIVSNAFPSVLGCKSARQKIRFCCRDYEGNVFWEEVHHLEPGGRIELNASEKLPYGDSRELITGSCWIYMDAVGSGYSGSTRPHFNLVTARSVTALHTQRANGPESFFITVHKRLTERQFLLHLNLKKRPIDVECTVSHVDNPEVKATFPRRIAPLGSDVFELPLSELSRQWSDGYFQMHSHTDTEVRRLLLVAGDDLTGVSADHI